MSLSMIRRLLFASLSALLPSGLVAGNDDAPPAAPPQTQPAASPAAPTLSLSPAIVMLKSKAGQSWTQTFRVRNQTPMSFQFEIEIQDVVTRDGKREFVAGG